MKCAKAQELFSSYLEKTIQPPMGVAFEQHLAECPQCKAEYDRFHATTVVLDELPAVEPPPDMHAVIMARVARARNEAPARVKWLHIDWQSVFSPRVPAKALAMGAAMMLVLVLLVQLSPLHTVTASLLGGRASQVSVNDPGVAPGPLPYGVKSGSDVKAADLDGGLSLAVSANSDSEASTAYTLKLGSRIQGSIPVQVSLVSDDSIGGMAVSKDLSKPQYVLTVSEKSSAAVTLFIPKSGENRAVKVAVVTWKSEGGSYNEYVFLPSSFGSAAKSELSVSEVGVSSALSRLSAEYGAVILAPSSILSKTASVSAGGTLEDAVKQMGLSAQLLENSIYSVK